MTRQPSRHAAALRQVMAQLDADMTCIGCGCSEFAPCLGGCHWVARDDQTGFGICSRCAEKPIEQLTARPTRYCECCDRELMLRVEADDGDELSEFEYVCRNKKCPLFSEG